MTSHEPLTRADEAPEQAHELLHDGFLRSARLHPGRPAVVAAGETLSYSELRERASSLAATLDRHAQAHRAPSTAVFAYRSPTAFAGVLAALLRGQGYVALNRRFPPDRTGLMLSRSEARALVVDTDSAAQLDQVLEGQTTPLVVLLPEADDTAPLKARFPLHVFLGRDDVVNDPDWQPRRARPEDTAYLMFTSGSTGTPKAVQILHANARRYVDVASERWALTEEDRCSQTFDMTFDLSVSDMFVTWEAGACLCCPPAEVVVKPAKFIQDQGLTVWFSVPSVGLLMKRLGMLKPGAYQTLRLCLFCGEPLPVELADAWASAAPNATIENIYGPTEVTIACTGYRYDGARAARESEFGVVPIGWPFPGVETRVVDESLGEVPAGETGELLLVGPQVTAGYWRDPEKTAAAFVRLPGDERVHYRTGDRVRRPVGDAPVTYLGRMDNQVKISGHRVELGEIEAVLREETGLDEVVAVGWPRIDTGYASVTAFVCAPTVDTREVRAAVARRLPDYMVPREVRALPEIPLNSNGKFDRNALVRMLEGAR